MPLPLKLKKWTNKSHRDGAGMGIRSSLTNKRHPPNFSGLYWTWYIHSLLSLLNYQIINRKSLWCSSLPYIVDSAWKWSQCRRQSLKIEGKNIPEESMHALESSCAWSQCNTRFFKFVGQYLLFFMWLSLHLVSIICSWSVLLSNMEASRGQIITGLWG